MKPEERTPKVVICAGLPRSASTWTYNATLALLRCGAKAIGVFSETIPPAVSEHLHDDICIVVKCHVPDEKLVALAHMTGSPIIISVRDPRDCLVSLRTIYNVSIVEAASKLAESASALVELHQTSNYLLMKYEDVNRDLSGIMRLAAYLRVEADERLSKQIADDLSIEKMREKLTRWEAAGIVDDNRWTDESHWHANHCGDAMIGKYLNSLSWSEKAIIEKEMGRFFDVFNYISTAPGLLKS